MLKDGRHVGAHALRSRRRQRGELVGGGEPADLEAPEALIDCQVARVKASIPPLLLVLSQHTLEHRRVGGRVGEGAQRRAQTAQHAGELV